MDSEVLKKLKALKSMQVIRTEETGTNKTIDKPISDKKVIDYAGRCHDLELQIKELQFDILTLYHFIIEELDDITMKEFRQKWQDFRSLDIHLRQRIKDKNNFIDEK